jgi:4a-hydroxytetrahydrobiopterin dehydratase
VPERTLTITHGAYHGLRMVLVLEPEKLRDELAGLSGWEGDTQAIRRSYTAPDFPTAIRIVDAVAEAAEQMNHHPDIDIRWRTLRFTNATHSAGGVTRYDIDLARRIDEIARQHGAT